MKTIKIYICDTEKFEENEDLGFIKHSDDKIYRLVNFKFRESDINGYWIDPDPNENGSRNIIFYISGETLTTPLCDESLTILDSCLE